MKQINLKVLWKHEALDFTPWLSKTRIIPDILRSIYHQPFYLYKTECPVQSYRLDMLYSSNNGDSVIIENQFGLSDNKHLGQNIVYSSLTKINKVLWICEDVSLEHRYISKEFSNIDIIPVSFHLYKEDDDYLLKVHVYSNINNCFVYKINNDLGIENISN